MSWITVIFRAKKLLFITLMIQELSFSHIVENTTTGISGVGVTLMHVFLYRQKIRISGIMKLTMPVCIGYYEKYYWKTECNLYYNVKQKMTFDEVITDKLSTMTNADERVEYYNLLIGNGNDLMYGNHQTLRNMLSESSIRNCNLKREFGYEMTDWNNENDGLYQGIKVYCNGGESLFAPFDCEIKEVDTDNKKIILRKDDVQYWYDGTGGTKRDAEVEATNCELISDYEKGDKIKLGEEFAKTTSENVDFHINVDTDGFGWNYIDPRLVLY